MKHARFPVIHVAELPWERQAKIALGMRRLGLPSLLIYVHQPNNFDPADFFDHVIQCESSQEAYNVAKRARPSIVHVSSFAADNCAALLVQNRFCKVVYDYKDVFENVIGWTQHPSYYAVQRLCIENADGLVCRDMQLWNYCRVNKVRTRGKRIFFPDYTWNTAPPRPARPPGDEIHVAYIGNFTVEKLYPQCADAGYIHTARALVAQGIHFHMYPHWHDMRFVPDPPTQMSEYYELEKSSKYFHLHSAVPLDAVHEAVAQYDIGIAVHQGGLFDIPIRTVLNQHERHGLAARVYEYVEVGIPVIVSDNLTLLKRILERSGTGISLGRGDMSRLRERLRAALDSGIGERVQAAKRRWAIDAQLPRLLKFYASL